MGSIMKGEIRMDSYGIYKDVRNAGWKCLVDYKIDSLPVKVSSIVRRCGCRLMPYSSSLGFIASLGAARFTLEKAFCLQPTQGQTFLFYNDALPASEIRLAVAHELGHLLLGHPFKLENGCRYTSNLETHPLDKPFETEANIFSRDLLSPACVLWALHLHSAQEISMLCDIPLIESSFREQRMKVLYKRECEFLKAYGHSCFLTHPLEHRVYEQFKDFVKQNLKEI